MNLEGLAKVVAAAGAGPLAFVALGLMVLTYLSARWFGTEKAAIRLTVFVALFLLICAAPVLIWMGDRYGKGEDDVQVAPAGNAVENSASSETGPARRAAADGSTQPDNPFREHVEPIDLNVSRFEEALRSGVFTVYFPFDSAEITATEASFLNDVADEYGRRGPRSVTLAGHTDHHSSAQYSVGLSQRAADAVRAYLVSKDIPEEAISTQSFGQSQPAVPGREGIPEPRNRRVEIRFVKN